MSISKNFTLAEALINYGADPHRKYDVGSDTSFSDSLGRTSIDYSIFIPEILKYFLETIPNPAAIATQQLSNICFMNKARNIYYEPVILAAEYCLNAGADLLAVNSKHESLIIQTLQSHCNKLFIYLLGKYKEKKLLSILEMSDQDGSISIIVAAKSRYVFGMFYLLAHKVNINAKNNAGQTAALIAVKYGNINEVLPFIVARVDMSTTDESGKKIYDYFPELKMFQHKEN